MDENTAFADPKQMRTIRRDIGIALGYEKPAGENAALYDENGNYTGEDGVFVPQQELEQFEKIYDPDGRLAKTREVQAQPLKIYNADVKPEERSFSQNLAEGFKRGYEDIGVALYDNALFGGSQETRNARRYDEARELGDPIQSDNIISKIFVDTARMLPAMGFSAAASMIPGVGPALSAAYWMKQGAGEAYDDMLEMGLDPDVARIPALATGALYGSIEMLQLAQIPGLNQLVKAAQKRALGKMISRIPAIGAGSLSRKAYKALGGGVKGALGAGTIHTAKTAAIESGEEAAQQLVMDYGNDLAVELNNMVMHTDIGKDPERADKVGRALDAFVESLGPMALIGGAGVAGAAAGRNWSKAVHKKNFRKALNDAVKAVEEDGKTPQTPVDAMDDPDNVPSPMDDPALEQMPQTNLDAPIFTEQAPVTTEPMEGVAPQMPVHVFGEEENMPEAPLPDSVAPDGMEQPNLPDEIGVANTDTAESEQSMRYTQAFGNVLSTDSAKLLFREQGYDPHDPESVKRFHPDAGAMVGSLFDEWLRTRKNTGNGTVIFTGGGNGSGKSSVLGDAPEADFVMDSAMVNLDATRNGIRKVIENGQTPVLAFAYRDPADAWFNGVQKRNQEADGHIVPETTFANTHAKARKNFIQLADEFGDQAMYIIREVRNKQNPQNISLDELRVKPDYTKEQILEVIHATTDGTAKEGSGALSAENHAARRDYRSPMHPEGLKERNHEPGSVDRRTEATAGEVSPAELNALDDGSLPDVEEEASIAMEEALREELAEEMTALEHASGDDAKPHQERVNELREQLGISAPEMNRIRAGIRKAMKKTEISYTPKSPAQDSRNGNPHAGATERMDESDGADNLDKSDEADNLDKSDEAVKTTAMDDDARKIVRDVIDMNFAAPSAKITIVRKSREANIPDHVRNNAIREMLADETLHQSRRDTLDAVARGLKIETRKPAENAAGKPEDTAKNLLEKLRTGEAKHIVIGAGENAVRITKGVLHDGFDLVLKGKRAKLEPGEESEYLKLAIANGQNTDFEKNPLWQPDDKKTGDGETDKATEPEEKRNIPETTKRSEEKDGKKNTIEDFGEKLEGARKDYFSRFAKAREKNIADTPLSQALPAPDYQKMVQNGMNPAVVSAIRVLRDHVGAKPKDNYRLEKYVKKVQALQDVFEKAMNGEFDRKINELERLLDLGNMRGEYRLYNAVGHQYNLKGYRLGSAAYSYLNGVKLDPPVNKSVISMGQARGWNKDIVIADSEADAVRQFREFLEKEDGNGTKETAFDVYSYRAGAKKGEIWIGKRINSPKTIDLVKVESAKDASVYINEHRAELEQKLKDAKHVPAVRGEDNRARIGEDYRKGKDVTPEMFQEAFAFRGVQFGNWVGKSEERQQNLNEAYDALHDLAKYMNISSSAISLNGELGLAFGARGNGGIHAGAAHYEPDSVVINLTRMNGAGSLAHEWFHALDNYFATRGGNDRNGYASDGKGRDAIRPEMGKAFNTLVGAISNHTKMFERGNTLDETRTKPYWGTRIEVMARTFEAYLKDKIERANESNDYLANISDIADFANALLNGKNADEAYPYPLEAELESVRKAFDDFIGEIREKDGENGKRALYSRMENSTAGGDGVDKLDGVGGRARENSNVRFSMKDDQANFAAAIEDYKNGTLNPRKPITVTGHTPRVLLNLNLADKEFRVFDRKISMPYGVIEKAIGRRASTSTGEGHHLTLEDLKKIPESLYNPVIVLDSNMQNSLEIITQIFDENNKPVIVALALDVQENIPGKRGGTYIVNSIRSAYGKDNANTIINRLKEGHGRYLNKKSAATWSRAAGVQFPGAGAILSRSPYIIIDESENVKLFSKKTETEHAHAQKNIGAMTPVERAIHNCAREFNAVEYRVVKNEAELPGHLRDDAQRHGDVEAVFDPEDGKIYFIASNLSVQRAPAVFLHEALGHYGMRQFFGKEFDALLDKVWRDFTPQLSELARKLGIESDSVSGRRHAAEEFIAKRAELKKSKPGIWLRIIAAVRAMIRKIKPFENLALSNAEIDIMLDKAYEAMKKMDKVDAMEGHGGTQIGTDSARYAIDEDGNYFPAPDEWGVGYRAMRGKGLRAIEFLLKKKEGFVPGAFVRDDLGEIDIVYGKIGHGMKDEGGYGLAHILKRHSGISWSKVANLIEHGKVTQKTNDDTAYIKDERNKAVIRLNWKGQKRKWVVSAMGDDLSLVADSLLAGNPAEATKQGIAPKAMGTLADVFPDVKSRTAQIDKKSRNSITPLDDSRDKEYINAVKRGDLAKAQEMVLQKAVETGVEILDDSASTSYQIRRGKTPQKTVVAYKLFATKKTKSGELFPLFVGADTPVPQGIWLDAIAGQEAAPSKTGKKKVKSKLGPLAYRPGWHAGDLPLATHIGVKDATGNIWARKKNEVWAEVEVSSDVDYQSEANENGRKADGTISVPLADIKRMPVDGMYRYKTNPNMTGNWIISGSMKINRVLSETEVNHILTKHNEKIMPWENGSLDLTSMGLTEDAQESFKKLLDPVTYDDSGNIVPLSERFNKRISDPRYSRMFEDARNVYQALREKDSNFKLDLSKLDLIFKTPLYYMQKVPALQRMFDAGQKFNDNKVGFENYIFNRNGDASHDGDNGGSDLADIDRFFKKNKAEGGRIRAYLWERDNNADGFTVSEQNGSFTVFDRKHKERGSFGSDSEAWDEAFRMERDELLADGLSNDAANTVLAIRSVNARSYDILRGDVERAEATCRAAGMELPKIDGVDIWDELRKIGDRRGHYMPRIRHGVHMLWAFKDGENPRLEIFDTSVARVLRKNTLQKQGYRTELERSNRPAEAAYRDLDIANMNDILNNALERVKDGSKLNFAELGLTAKWIDYERKDGKTERHFTISGFDTEDLHKIFREFGGRKFDSDGTWHFIKAPASLEKNLLNAVYYFRNIEQKRAQGFAQAMAEEVAQIIHERGSASRKISRDGKTGKEVFKGYEEDIPKAVKLSGCAIASGAAKKILARETLAAFTGTDLAWEQFKQQHMNPDLAPGTEEFYREIGRVHDLYLQEVNERRVDSAKQPNAFKEGMEFRAELLRNTESSERVVGFVRSLAALKYLSSPSSAAINLTAMLTNVPAAMSHLGHIPLVRANAGLVKSSGDFLRYVLYSKFGKGSAPKPEQRQLYDEIIRRGWDSDQMNKEAMQIGTTFAANGYRKLSELAMLCFASTERFNRAVTIAASYEAMLAKEPEASAERKEELLLKAKDISDRAHGVYGKSNAPGWTRGSSAGAQALRSFYMFKTFSHNYLQLMAEMIGQKHITSAAYLLLAPAIVGGVGASLISPVAKGIQMALEQLGAEPPEDLLEEFYRWLADTFGTGTERFARYGASGVAGMNVKGSLNMDFELPQTIGDILGAPYSVGKDFVQGAALVARGDLFKGAEKLAPRFAANWMKAYRESTEGVTKSNNQPVFWKDQALKADFLSALLRSVGFNPVELSEKTEAQWNEQKAERAFAERRSNIYAAYRRALLSGDTADFIDIYEKIEAYNARVRRSGRRNIPTLTGKTLKAAATKMNRPDRREKLRAAAGE